VLVPAVVIELDRRVWWPSALARGTAAAHTARRTK
jgi:hypothetical protein